MPMPTQFDPADLSPVDDDLLWIRKVKQYFGVSHDFIYANSEPHGPLRRVTVPGDQRTFVRISQLRMFLRPSDVV